MQLGGAIGKWTGLALLGYRRLDHALGVRPRLVENVTEAHFDRLDEALAAVGLAKV